MKHYRAVRGMTCLLLLSAACGRERAIDDARLRSAAADTANWLTYGHTYSEQRFSPLRQIDEQTVGRLGLAWSLDLKTMRGLEATSLVKDGVLYTTGAWSTVFAVDARTGQQLWTYDPKVPKEHSKYVCCDVVNRGVALYGRRVYAGTLDGRLIALDAKTGALDWEVQSTPKGGPYAITGAPRIARGNVIIGNAGSEFAVRGFVAAYNADTGAEAWKTYIVPGDPARPFESDAMRTAAATWGGEWWKGGGGGSPWDPIVYDPVLDLIYIGTGNGSPWYPELRSKNTGDNLYVASIIALRATNGELVWHYQTTPGDAWDYDSTQPILLANLTIDGRERRTLMQANKNGFFYVLDRENGKLISARPYAEVTWATGIDSTGRPIENPAARKLAGPTIVKPSPEGAHNWNPISFNTNTGLVYFAVVDNAYMHAVDPNFKLDTRYVTVGGDPRYDGPILAQWLAMKTTGWLVAWDPVAQREVWRVEHPDPKSGGTLTTAGNLVFQGRGDGKLRAYRATDGKVLWEVDTGVGISAPPITYAIDNKQFVSVLAGWGGPGVLYNDATGHGKVGPGKLLAFTLDGTATMPLAELKSAPVPMPTFELKATAADVKEGGVQFNAICASCHGAMAVSAGSVPDLRYSNAATHAMFEQIVRGGARKAMGMPAFDDILTSDQVRMIQAFVIARARQSAAEEKSRAAK